jgi:hypothetical protein
LSSACEGLENRGQGFVILREPGRVLPRNQILSHPHGELASPAFHQLGVDPGFLLDERRHTGSARMVVSNHAISDADALHEVSPPEMTLHRTVARGAIVLLQATTSDIPDYIRG